MKVTQYLPLGCYGKVPSWREYLEVNASYPSSREFKTWVREGRGAASSATASEDGERRFVESTTRRFLFSPPGSTDILIGVIAPSQDQAGRENSFAAFVPLPRRYYGKHYGLLPSALGPVWEAIEDTWAGLYEAPTRGAMEEQVEATLIPAPVPYAEVRGEYEALKGEAVAPLFRRNDGATFAALESNLPDVVTQMKKQGGEGVRVEMPLSEDPAAACLETSLWIELINNQFMWKRFEPSVFIEDSKGGSDRKVLLAYGRIDPSDYLPIMGTASSSDGVLRPAHTAVETDTTPEVDDDNPDTTYGRLLTLKFDS